MTPVGTLLAWSETVELKPPEVVIVIAAVVLGPPGSTDLGEGPESVKDCA